MIAPCLPIPLSLISAAQQEELEQLLGPLANEPPCGPAIRYDPVFTEIRLAREEDDPSLPMGQWERPLKRADWELIETRCKEMLGTRSKDLQIAAWLLEAWTRQYGFAGLYRGLSLIERMLRQYWTALHPVIQDGDCDARVAPLEWLNESVSVTLRIHVPLLSMANCKPPTLTFADWERMTARELGGPGHTVETGEPQLTRVDVLNYAHKHLFLDMDTKVQLIEHCVTCLESMLCFVDEQLGMEAPNLSKLKGTLVAVGRVFAQLRPERKGPEMTTTSMAQGGEAAPADGAEAAPAVAVSHWKNRHEAYATLGALADYLSLVEPHSPTPYLLRRAVNWGNMPLPELMAEFIKEEGDLNRLVNLLGLKE